MKKILVLGLLMSALCLVLVACSSTKEESKDEKKNDGAINIKIGHVVTEDTSIHKKFVKFKEVLEETSDGQFTVEIFPNSQLGDERELTESTQFGNLQITSPDIGAVARISPALQVFNLPFLFKDSEEAHKVLDSDLGKELLADLEKDGLYGLGYAENGWRHLTTKKGPITNPEELKGLKLRTMEDPLHLDFWKELGLSPTPLAFSEVYTSLSQGVVEGQENPLELIESMKFYEVNPYITLTGHIYAPELFLINKDFFEGLNEEQQKLVQSAADEAIAYQRELNAELELALKEELKAQGATVTELTSEQKDIWIEKVKPIYKKYANEIGEETVKSVFEAANNTVGLESMD